MANMSSRHLPIDGAACNILNKIVLKHWILLNLD